MFESMPNVAIADESMEFNKAWRTLSALPTSSPKVWMDSYLAAFAISNGYTLVTFDKGFVQYPGLKFELLN